MPGRPLLHRIQTAARVLTGSVTVEIKDGQSGWIDLLRNAAPADRPASELYQDQLDALEGWYKNFQVRRIVGLVSSYVVGSGLSLKSEIPQVNNFLNDFWNHRQNRIAGRLRPMCDELTRAGEIFPVLHTNPADGMSYLRFVPATVIDQIETAENDYEIEFRYHTVGVGFNPPGVGLDPPSMSGRWWLGFYHPLSWAKVDSRFPPLMLHFAVNRPIGAIRGDGDLNTILPWAKRYAEWLKDRVRLNRIRTRQGLMDIEISDPAEVTSKRTQILTDRPLESGVYIHGPGEKVTIHNLNLDAADAAEDGRQLRHAVAAGSNLALHYLGEGDRINYATAKEMGEPTARWLTERQETFAQMLVDLATAAYHRLEAHHGRQPTNPADLQISYTAGEVARADNQTLAKAGRDIATALKIMSEKGWIEDDAAAEIALKFIGELKP